MSTAAPAARAPAHIVCLPGAFHTAEDFLAAGFDVRVRHRGLHIDLSFVDVDMEHLGDRSAVGRLRREIVLPARAAGYESIWLAGISLGGFIALDYAACHPGDLDGLCLIAPYLGNRMLTREIAQAPGLAGWAAGEIADFDDDRRIWRFIQAQHAPKPGAPAPPAGPRPWCAPLLYLGYGDGDRFADAHRLLAGALPPDSVDVVPGGHDWPTWTTLWENFLESRFS